jgi:hypothetical protein
MILTDISVIPSTTTTTTTGSLSWGDVAWQTVEPTKKERIGALVAKIESEDRLKLILEKVKTKKLSVDEAIAVLKGDKSIEIG